MKNPQLKNATLLAVCTIFVLTACEKKDSRIQPGYSAETAELPPLIKTALISDKPFFSLAQLMKQLNAGPIMLEERSDSALAKAQIHYQLQKKSSPLKKHILTRGLPYSNDIRLLQRTLAFAKNPLAFTKVGFFEEHDLSTRIEIQNQALASIISTFEKRSLDLARKLAPHVIKGIAENSSEDIERIKKLTGVREEKINALVSILQKHEWIFSDYSFSAEEQARLLVIGMIAGIIVDDLSKHKTVQDIIAVAKDIGEKAKILAEVCSLVQVLEMNKAQIRSDWEAMRQAISNAHSQIEDLQSAAGKNSAHTSEIARFIRDALTGRVRKVKEGSFLSEKQEIGKNLETFVASATSAANSLDNLLDAAETIASKVGITFGKDLQNAITTARTISSLVSVTNTVINAYAGGGVIAALGVFGSDGSGFSLLGGNPGQSSLASELHAVKQDLKEIKMLQRQMIELQMSTVKMIRDLALMSQAQHQEEMSLLREIKGHAMVAEEAARMNMHSKITSCEQMIEFGLHNSRNYKATPFHLASTSTQYIARSLLYKNLRTKDQLNQFIRSWSANNFKQCQQALADAFSFSTAQESVLKLLVNPSDVNSAISFFHSARYKPLVNFLHKLQSERSLNLLATGLHLPVQRFSEILSKSSYARTQRESFSHLYDLDTLISTDSLARYVHSLLILAPIVAFDRETWVDYSSNGHALDENYDLAWKRARHWLENAMVLIQSAIAQETLLSGEVLLTELLPFLDESIKTKEDCYQSKGSLTCVIKSNPVLRKNLLNYALYRHLKISPIDEQYKRSFEESDIPTMEALLGSAFIGQIVKIKDSAGKERLHLRWNDSENSFFTELPSVSEIYEEKIVYSENLARLLGLQESVADALVGMTPSFLTSIEKKGLIEIYRSNRGL